MLISKNIKMDVDGDIPLKECLEVISIHRRSQELNNLFGTHLGKTLMGSGKELFVIPCKQICASFGRVACMGPIMDMIHL